MGVMELKTALMRIAGLYGAAGSKDAAQDLRAVAGLMQETRASDVGELAAEITDALAPAERLVQAYIERFSKADVDRSAFAKVLADLKADRNMTKADVGKIATAYSGDPRSWKSKAEALREIEASFVSRAYQASKMKIVQGYKPW